MNAELAARLRKAATCIYLATEESVADDISALLKEAAAALSATAQEPVAFMFFVREDGNGRGRQFAAIDYNLQDGETLISKEPLYDHPPADAERLSELDSANTALATESHILRSHLDALIYAIDGMENLDPLDGSEFAEAEKRLNKAVEAARPLLEKVMLEKVIADAAIEGEAQVRRTV